MVAQPWDYNKNDRIVYFKRVNFMGCESFLKDFRFIRKHETFQNNTPLCYLLGSSQLPGTQPLGPAAPMPFFQLRTWELRAGEGPVRTALPTGARGAMGSGAGLLAEGLFPPPFLSCLCWVFTAAGGPSLVAAGGLLSNCTQASLWGGFSCCGAEALGCAGFSNCGTELPCSCEIFLDRGWNPCPLHWRVDF